jgi:hypothetical protein
LNGSASSDAVGSIVSYQWRQISGPSTSVLSNPNSVITIARTLVAGSYQFELKVTDDSTAVGRDTVVITVNTAPPAQRFVKVNVFGGVAPAGTGWNNWNVVNSLNSTAFAYADGGASTITAALSANTVVADNGAGYPTTMCPTEVGRTTSYSTLNRTLTISGLDNNKNYNIELYSSRIGGNPTKFTVGTTSITIPTSNNYTIAAVFINLTPSLGKIVVNVDVTITFAYINGFTLTENTIPTGRITSTNASDSLRQGSVSTHSDAMSNDCPDKVKPQVTSRNSDRKKILSENSQLHPGIIPAYHGSIESKTPVLISPNPFSDKLELQFANRVFGGLRISLVDENGRIIKTFLFKKEAEFFKKEILLQNLPPGIYFVQLQMQGWREVDKVIKM